MGHLAWGFKRVVSLRGMCGSREEPIRGPDWVGRAQILSLPVISFHVATAKQGVQKLGGKGHHRGDQRSLDSVDEPR